MPAYYKLIRNLSADPEADEKSLPPHPEFAPQGTVRIPQLLEGAQERTAFTSADMRGMLQLIQDLICQYLRNGYNVEMEGIGTFSLALKGRTVTDKGEIRSESIHFKDVRFRACNELRNRLRSMDLLRFEKATSDPASLSATECESHLSRYLDERGSILRSQYMKLANAAPQGEKRPEAAGRGRHPPPGTPRHELHPLQGDPLTKDRNKTPARQGKRYGHKDTPGRGAPHPPLSRPCDHHGRDLGHDLHLHEGIDQHGTLAGGDPAVSLHAGVCCLLAAHRRLWAGNWRDEGLLCLAGLCGGSLYFIAENTALGIPLASNVSLIVCTSPIITTFLSTCSTRRR